MGYWHHIDRAEGVPGEKRIVKLLREGECSEVSWLNSVEPVPPEMGNNNNINQDRVKRTRERNPIGRSTHIFRQK